MSLIKTATLALAALALSAGAASAAQIAYADHDAQVKLFHQNASPTVNWIADGQQVKVIDHFGNWVFIKIPGQDGWVKATALDFAPGPVGPVNGGSFCVAGSGASFCINASF